VSQLAIFEPDGKIPKALRSPAGGRTREGLPWSGRTAISKHRSAQAAQAAAQTRVFKSLRYLDLLTEAGARGLSDHETHAATGWPISSVCSIRGGLMEAGLVVPGERVGVSPYGRAVTTWVKRAAPVRQ
jgi:hypothetical protein